MQLSIMGFSQYMSYYWNKEIDPQAADLPLVSSSYKIPFIIFAYLYLVLDFGPQFMKRRPPYSLTTFMRLYNIVQIMVNTWVIYDIIDTGLFSIESTCPILDYSNDNTSIKFTRGLWYIFLIKILDLTETVVFVLRKKDNQISTLHLYHHVTTLFLAWITVRYYVFPAAIISYTLNSFVHVFMYVYYFLAAWGPNVQKIIAPMKRWLTVIQMVQLVIILSIALQVFMVGCKVDNLFVLAVVADVAINLYMFYRFYQQTYMKHKKIP